MQSSDLVDANFGITIAIVFLIVVKLSHQSDNALVSRVDTLDGIMGRLHVNFLHKFHMQMNLSTPHVLNFYLESKLISIDFFKACWQLISDSNDQKMSLYDLMNHFYKSFKKYHKCILTIFVPLQKYYAVYIEIADKFVKTYDTDMLLTFIKQNAKSTCHVSDLPNMNVFNIERLCIDGTFIYNLCFVNALNRYAEDECNGYREHVQNMPTLASSAAHLCCPEKDTSLPPAKMKVSKLSELQHLPNLQSLHFVSSSLLAETRDKLQSTEYCQLMKRFSKWYVDLNQRVWKMRNEMLSTIKCIESDQVLYPCKRDPHHHLMCRYGKALRIETKAVAQAIVTACRTLECIRI